MPAFNHPDHPPPHRTVTSGRGWRARRGNRAGFTIVETAVAAALITLFLSSLFLLNTLVLRMLRAGNETANASLILQARAEQIRMSNWLDITNAGYLSKTLLARQPDTSINLSALTETVSVGPYQFDSATQPEPAYIFQRTPDGQVTATGGTGAALAGSDCLQFIITERWNGWGGRVRERSLVTLASTWGIGQQ